MGRRPELVEALESIAKVMSIRDLASRIDSTILSPTAGIDQVYTLIEDASGFGFNCAMVPPPLAVRARDAADSLNVKLCTVIGFPSGFQPGEAKISEIRLVSDSVREIDVVAPLWAAASGEPEYVVDELSEIVGYARDSGIETVKIIVEAPLVDDNTLDFLVETAKRAGADYVKTSTGVYSKGGDPSTVLRLSELAKPRGLKVKAAGGIRTALDALLAISAGADRIGTSSAKRIILDYARLTGETI